MEYRSYLSLSSCLSSDFSVDTSRFNAFFVDESDLWVSYTDYFGIWSLGKMVSFVEQHWITEYFVKIDKSLPAAVTWTSLPTFYGSNQYLNS